MVGVSTRGFYDRSASAMTALTARADALQTQISTTKKLQAPSDDAVGYQRLQALKTTGANEAVYAANVKIAAASLAQADSTLGDINTQLQKAGELAVQGGNGTLSAEGKKAVAAQLRDVLTTIVGFANTTDARGQALFGGAESGAAVAMKADGSLAFAPGQPSAIPIGEGQQVQVGVRAGDVLAIKDGKDIAQVLDAMADALEAGGMPDAADTKALEDISKQAVAAQSSVGARAVRVEMQAAYFTSAAIEREDVRSGIEDTDVTVAITELQKTMTILSATQASFSKLSGLSLFDYLR